MSAHENSYAQIILPLAIGWTFSYKIPKELESEVSVGKRVTVQFGRGRKLRTGIVAQMGGKPQEGVRVKPILGVLDKNPIVTNKQLDFWKQIARHYLCSLGEVLIAAMPGQLLIDSETTIIPLPYSDLRLELPPKEQTALAILDDRNALRIEELGKLLDLKDPMPKVRKWMDKGIVNVEEEIVERFKARTKKVVKLAKELHSESALNSTFDQLQRAPKQTHLLMSMIQMADPLDGECVVDAKRLLKMSNATMAVIKQLEKKAIVQVLEVTVSPKMSDSSLTIPELTPAQESSLQQIREGFANKDVCLFQGVTSSGKTEVYLKFIEDAFSLGKQVLYLLPEIALTTQMVQRISKRMGSAVHVYHSKLTDRERARVYKDLIEYPERVRMIVSARSGLFLPFTNLDTIIVDEEHDSSFKQHDPAPRYQARDMSVVLGQMHGAKVLLGSATPSMESLNNAKTGKYAFAQLSERFGGIRMPKIVMSNIQEASKRKLMRGRFGPELLQAIADRLMRKEQVVLFQNRRGYTPIWQCTSCGWVPECDNCDVSLTYHKFDDALRCHYCGRIYQTVAKCRACHSDGLKMHGFGTEMLEEELKGLFPEAKVARLDQDTTRKKNSYLKIMQRMEDGEIDILVGTQMITKGLDLEHVTLVGVMNADALIKFPEFRASERAFQLMCQVAGRAGRRSKEGEVIIQTYDPFQATLQSVKQHDTNGAYERELPQRDHYNYPPFSRLVRITLRHKNRGHCEQAANRLFHLLSSYFRDRAIGPEKPYVARVRNLHIRNILIKINKRKHKGEKAALEEFLARFQSIEEFRNVRLSLDVDPN